MSKEIQKQLKQLKSQSEAIWKQRDKINSQIRKLELELELPKLKKQYEGKYFRFNNGYNSTDRWGMYVKVIAVTGLNDVEIISIEKDSYGKIELHRETVGLSILEQPINKLVFDKQFDKLLKELTK